MAQEVIENLNSGRPNDMAQKDYIENWHVGGPMTPFACGGSVVVVFG